MGQKTFCPETSDLACSSQTAEPWTQALPFGADTNREITLREHAANLKRTGKRKTHVMMAPRAHILTTETSKNRNARSPDAAADLSQFPRDDWS
jgi:hypothetical protein